MNPIVVKLLERVAELAILAIARRMRKTGGRHRGRRVRVERSALSRDVVCFVERPRNRPQISGDGGGGSEFD